MNLSDALNKVKDPKDWTISFKDEANEINGFLRPTTINIAELYKDWYGSCDHCPENDEIVFGIVLSNDNTGETYLVSVNNPLTFTFEMLMEEMEGRFLDSRQRRVELPMIVELPEITECCAHCGGEVTMRWNVKTEGYKAYCPSCGERLMLCDECRHPDGEFCDTCDYDIKTDSCKHSRKDNSDNHLVSVRRLL